MKRGFYTIMSAQFFSSLADNALFVTAVELLKSDGAAEWQRAALVPMFALFYVVLAPFVGAFADAVRMSRRALSELRIEGLASNLPLLHAPKDGAKVSAYLKGRSVAQLDKCEKGWCRLKADGASGWAPEDEIWGAKETLQCPEGR